MLDLIRDSTVGQLVNKLSRGRLLPYADQRADYVVPERYRHLARAHTILDDTTIPTPEKGLSLDDTSKLPTRPTSPEVEVPSSRTSTLVRDSVIGTTTAIEKTKDVEEGDAIRLAETFKEHEVDVKINPSLVDWDGPNDPDNPRYVILKSALLTTFMIFAIEIGRSQKDVSSPFRFHF